MTAGVMVSFRVEDFTLSPLAQLRPLEGMDCPFEVMSQQEQRIRVRYEHDRTSLRTKIPRLIDQIQVDISLRKTDLVLRVWIERSAGDSRYGGDLWEYNPDSPDAERPAWVDEAYKGALMIMREFLCDRITEKSAA